MVVCARIPVLGVAMNYKSSDSLIVDVYFYLISLFEIS